MFRPIQSVVLMVEVALSSPHQKAQAAWDGNCGPRFARQSTCKLVPHGHPPTTEESTLTDHTDTFGSLPSTFATSNCAIPARILECGGHIAALHALSAKVVKQV